MTNGQVPYCFAVNEWTVIVKQYWMKSNQRRHRKSIQVDSNTIRNKTMHNTQKCTMPGNSNQHKLWPGVYCMPYINHSVFFGQYILTSVTVSSVFIAWTEWTLTMALPWWQHYKYLRAYYYYYYYYYYYHKWTRYKLKVKIKICALNCLIDLFLCLKIQYQIPHSVSAKVTARIFLQ